MENSKKISIVVLVVWGILLVGSVFLGLRFFGNQEMSNAPPKGTRSAKALAILEEKFGEERIPLQPVFLLIQGLGTHTVYPNNPTIGNWSLWVHDKINHYPSTGKDLGNVYNISGAYLTTLPAVQQSYVSSNKSATFITINYVGSEGKAFVKYLNDHIIDSDQTKAVQTHYLVNVTGTEALIMDASKGFAQDTERMEIITVPVAFFILALALWSVKLIIFPFFTVPTAILFSMSIMYLVSLAVKVPSFIGSIMLAMNLALSIDYSLFLLSRFRDEVRNKAVTRATYLSLRHSGETILVSGTTIAIAFAGLIAFPISTFRVLGIASFVAVTCTMLSALALIPASLYVFGNFLKPSPCWLPSCCGSWLPHSVAKKYVKPKDGTEPLLLNTNKVQDSDNVRAKQMKSIWFKISKLVHKWNWVVLLIAGATFAPCAWQLFQMKLEYNLFHMLPRKSPAVDVFQRMGDIFGEGRTNPYFLVISKNQTKAVMSNAFFDVTRSIIDTMRSETGYPLLNGTTSIAEIAIGKVFTDVYWDNKSSIFTSAMYLLQDQPPHSPNICNMSKKILELCETYEYIFGGLTSVDYSASYVPIQLPDPLGESAIQWAKHARKIIDRFTSNNPGYSFYLGGGATASLDALDVVYAHMPLMIGVTFGVIVVVVFIAFRSVMIPLILAVCMMYTLVVTFGLAVIVFQYSWIHSAWHAFKGVDAIVWYVPVMAFPMICGLALDYGIFSLTRTAELRKEGFTDDAACMKSNYKINSTIASAGIIMFAAFSGLIIAEEDVLNEFGFCLCVSVLLDTFVIVPFILPAFMSLTSKVKFGKTTLTWWPAALPEGTKTVDDPDQNEAEWYGEFIG